MFVVILTVYFICTYLSESIEPFGNYLTCLLSDLSFLSFEIWKFLYVFFFTYPELCIGQDTRGCCIPSQLIKCFMPNVSRRLIRTIETLYYLRQVHLDPSVGYDFVRMLSLLIPVLDIILLGCYHC